MSEKENNENIEDKFENNIKDNKLTILAQSTATLFFICKQATERFQGPQIWARGAHALPLAPSSLPLAPSPHLLTSDSVNDFPSSQIGSVEFKPLLPNCS